MKYILIMLLWNYGALSLTTAEFNNLTACHKAMEEVKQLSMGIQSICVSKD